MHKKKREWEKFEIVSENDQQPLGVKKVSCLY
jgi:hypothetical protein